MVDVENNKAIVIRETEESDMEVVGKLEKKCETTGSNKGGASIFTNRVVDPLSRIRFYPLHVMLVAELRENRQLVGVIRGCIKHVGTKFGATDVKLGCILGLRVSPRHRRMGIGLQLVRAMEEWMMRNKADYTILATEKNNVASRSLFTVKCNYRSFSSLVIFVQPVINQPKTSDDFPKEIKIEKLQIGQAISLYENKLRGKDIYPTDMDAILKEKLSLGTWVFYFKQERWAGNLLGSGDDHEENNIIKTSPSSWIMFSIWNSCKAACNNIIHVRKSSPLNLKSLAKATLSHARDKILPCLKLPIFCDSSLLDKPFGFLFLYGIYGEGDRVGELMKCAWTFASRLAENAKDCRVVIAEMGVSDPLVGHVPREASISCIDDIWYLKKVNGNVDLDGEDSGLMGEVGNNVFVDPRDF